MRVLVACEFSGVVREAFGRQGHDSYSCDLLPSDIPSERHFECDVRDLLDGSREWDLLIAHPPCQYLCLSGLHWNYRIAGRSEKTEEALDFVRLLLSAPVPKIALENPVGAISKQIRPPDQYIQPYEFGTPESKKTGLWLKGLPPLRPTEILSAPRLQANGSPRWDNQTGTGQNKLGPSADRWKRRSVTYPKIAAAMAAQWGVSE